MNASNTSQIKACKQLASRVAQRRFERADALMAAYWDNWPQCTCDFWAGLTDNAWHHFADPSHFGNSYQGIPALRNGKLIKRKVALVQLPEGNRDINPAKRFANEHVKEGSNVHFQEKLPYLERFSYFFSRDFSSKGLRDS